MVKDKDIACKECGKRPDQISEYINYSHAEDMTPVEYVKQEEGTYNPQTGKFYCTSCYIKKGCPRGKA